MFKFDVAISYAGEEEGLAEDLYRLLCQNKVNVFFAKPFKVYLWGKMLTPELKEIYGGINTKFVVPIISKHYVKKTYPSLEFRTAKEGEKGRNSEIILPLILDRVSLRGLESDRNYIDLQKEGLLSTAKIIVEKLRPSLEERLSRLYTGKKLKGPIGIYVPTVWIATFGVAIENLLKSPELLPFAPRDYASLCDWLEKDLIDRVSNSPIKRYKLIEDLRTGETLSIRIVFEWDPVKEPFDFGDIGWWEILEIAEFEDIYPSQSGKEFLNIGENE